MVLTFSIFAYYLLCLSLIFTSAVLLSPSSHTFFTSPFPRVLLTVLILGLCYTWITDYQAMYNTPEVTQLGDSCEERLKMMEFKQDFAKLQRDVYIKAMAIFGLVVCMAVAVKEKRMQREREYYQTSLKAEAGKDKTE